MIFEPDEHTSLENFAWTRDQLVLVTLVDVASRVELVTPGSWERAPIAGIPPNTNTVVVDVDEYGDEIFLDSSGFDTPSRLLWGHAGGEVDGDQERAGVLRRVRHRGHAALRRVGRRHDDPVLRRGASTVRPGPGPTLLERLRRLRELEHAGLRRRPGPAVAGPRRHLRAGQHPRRRRVRPAWHTQAMREGRHLVDEDFAAVARDLVERGITTVEQLGAQGGSNGGLLMGIMLTEYPELFGALVCSVPLLDMRAVPPAAGRRVVGGRVRRPRQPRRLGVHLRILAVPEHLRRTGATRRC